jgi:hypothetical protein
MNRPEPPQGMNTALEQVNAAVKSILRKWRARRAAKADRPEDRPGNPPAAGG